MTDGNPGTQATNQAFRQLLEDIVAGRPATLSPALGEVPEAIAFVAWLDALQVFALALAKGNLTAPATGKGPVIGSLKSLQASLRHLTFQTRLVADGDFTQRVDFMGEFAQSFNTMVLRLQQAYADLTERNHELETLTKVQEKMASIVAHDLRNPLQGILSGVQLLLEMTDVGKLDPNQQRFLKLIEQSALSQLGMINRLLDLTSMQRRANHAGFQPVPLARIIQETAAAVRPMCEIKGLWLRLDVQEEVCPLGDANHLGQVITNLLSNALKFTERGGVTITARQRGSEVLVQVEDTGKGIPPETLPKLFLGHLTTTGTNGEKGTGIGLPLCRDIIAAHQGRLWAESEPGRGTTFFIALPSWRSEENSTVQPERKDPPAP